MRVNIAGSRCTFWTSCACWRGQHDEIRRGVCTKNGMSSHLEAFTQGFFFYVEWVAPHCAQQFGSEGLKRPATGVFLSSACLIAEKVSFRLKKYVWQRSKWLIMNLWKTKQNALRWDGLFSQLCQIKFESSALCYAIVSALSYRDVESSGYVILREDKCPSDFHHPV